MYWFKNVSVPLWHKLLFSKRSLCNSGDFGTLTHTTMLRPPLRILRFSPLTGILAL